MRLNKRADLVSLSILLAAGIACGQLLPNVSSEGAPGESAGTPAPGDEAAPEPETEARPSPTPVDLAPGENPFYRAMRQGFAGDVDEFGDLIQYEIVLEMADDPVTLVGMEKVTYRNNTGTLLEDLVFRLYPNGLTGLSTLLQVSSAVVDGEPADFRTFADESALQIILPEPAPPGAEVTVTLAFTFTLPPEVQIGYGRISDIDGIVSMPSFFPMLSVYTADGWWIEQTPVLGDPVYSEASLYDVTLSAPSRIKIASTGTVIETSLSNGTATYRIVTGPVRDFAIAASERFGLTSATRDGVTVNVWSYGGDTVADQAALDYAFASLRIFGDVFGPYPFSEVDVVEAPIAAGGIEYPGLIFILNDIWSTDNPFFERVVVHEMGHQWWYSMVGNDQVTEPWLDEGLTEYSVEVYYREHYSDQAGDSLRAYYEDELAYYLEEEGDSLPVGLPADDYNDFEYRVFVYSAGGLFFSRLEDQFGEAAVYDYLQQYYDTFRYQNSSNVALEQLTGEVLGQEALDFYEEWVYGTP